MRVFACGIVLLIAAGVARGADGGTISFKTYYSAENSWRIVAPDASPLCTETGFYLTLLDSDLNQVMGVKEGTSSVAPVVACFNGTSGFVTLGGNWALEGFEQGRAYTFAVAAFYDPNNSGLCRYAMTTSALYPVTLGGPDLVPPALPGELDFGGAHTAVYASVHPFPEPSVFALGVIGMGSLLLRRRR